MLLNPLTNKGLFDCIIHRYEQNHTKDDIILSFLHNNFLSPLLLLFGLLCTLNHLNSYVVSSSTIPPLILFGISFPYIFSPILKSSRLHFLLIKFLFKSHISSSSHAKSLSSERLKIFLHLSGIPAHFIRW